MSDYTNLRKALVKNLDSFFSPDNNLPEAKDKKGWFTISKIVAYYILSFYGIVKIEEEEPPADMLSGEITMTHFKCLVPAIPVLIIATLHEREDGRFIFIIQNTDLCYHNASIVLTEEKIRSLFSAINDEDDFLKDIHETLKFFLSEEAQIP